MSLLNAVLAWDSIRIQIGTLRGQDLELKVAPHDLPLTDIRNCSSVGEQRWGAVTGVNRQTGRQELWRFDIEGTRTESLVAANYILNNAIDPLGRHICYTAPPARSSLDMSLYVYDVETSRSDLIVENTVSRFCTLSWRPSTSKVVYHTVDSQVMEVDINTKDMAVLFKGEYPAVSPDGARIAFREGNALRVWSAEDQHVMDVPVKRRLWDGQLQGGMSWSQDGKSLLVSQSAGVLGYERAFYRIEVASGERVRIRQRYLHGLRFR